MHGYKYPLLCDTGFKVRVGLGGKGIVQVKATPCAWAASAPETPHHPEAPLPVQYPSPCSYHVHTYRFSRCYRAQSPAARLCAPT